jgi:hypothetical protein
MAVNFKNIALLIALIAAILLAVAIYNAYVINKPCHHGIKALDEKDKLKLDAAMIERMQKALKIKTISYADKQDKSKLVEYINFIRKGRFIYFRFIPSFSLFLL